MGGRRCGKRAEWWQVRRANLSRYTLAVRETGEESVWGGRSAEEKSQDSGDQKDERDDIPEAVGAGAPEHTKRVYGAMKGTWEGGSTTKSTESYRTSRRLKLR